VRFANRTYDSPQVKEECRPFAFVAFGPDFPAVGLDDHFADD
jgi:hypothetical protein